LLRHALELYLTVAISVSSRQTSRNEHLADDMDMAWVILSLEGKLLPEEISVISRGTI